MEPFGGLDSLLGESLLDPSDDSIDGSNYVPPEGALLGDSLEAAVCGANLWILFEDLLRLSPEEL